jgi:chemotaxis protein methyltransferase CheR
MFCPSHQIQTGKGDRKLKKWSAGCSTGEEPYSIAMLLKDVMPPNFSCEVIASDLSLKSLMTAKEGYYPDSASGEYQRSI